jgi:hypothetical protein
LIRNDVAWAKYRSKLDMSDAYEQVRIEPDDVWKTVFSTVMGTYTSHVMQMGDCNGPSTFQRLMTRIFFKQIGKSVHVYLDDIFIFSTTIEEHEEQLKIVFELLRKYHLFLAKHKVQLYAEKIDCLGHVIDDMGIHADADKMRMIREWPTPQNYHDIQRFLGLVNHLGQFMPDISAYTAPLLGMSSQTLFRWNPIHQKCFESIKTMACKAPILKPIDPDNLGEGEQIFLITDASPHGIGAYYGQGKIWETCRPAGFMSKKFSTAQFSYFTYEQETLAVLEGLGKWEDKLLGRKFVIVTDHQAIEFFQRTGKLTPRQVRWWEYISRFDNTVVYVEGERNKVADALSRYYSSIPEGEKIPEDVYVMIDSRLDPEGDHLPIDWLVEAKVVQTRKMREREDTAVKESEVLNVDQEEPKVPELPTTEDMAWSSNTPNTPLKIQLEGTDVYETIRTHYKEDLIFGKILQSPEQHKLFKIKKNLIITTNIVGNAVVCVPRVKIKGRFLTQEIVEHAHKILGHKGYAKVLDYI